MDKATHEKLLRQQPHKVHRPICFSCEEADPLVLEEHHMVGKAYSDEAILLCKNCHAKVTAGQNLFPPKARSHKAPLKERLTYALYSLILLIEQILSYLKDLCLEIVGAIPS